MKRLILLSALFIVKTSLAQTILGIDVSSYQGTVNWTSVKNAGYTFAWAKATEGITFTDSQYLNNAVNGVNAGMYMGAYHFARPDNNPTNADAVSEANHFLSVAQPYIVSCQLPPVLDLEVSTSLTNSQLTAWVQTWMNTVQAATGITPILYTDGSIANSLGSSLASYCKLWIADPDGSPTVSPSSTYLGVWYPNWSFKQYSWTGTVPGISGGSVDLDSFNGTLQGLKNLMGCTPPVCNTYYANLPYSTSFETAWLMDSCAGVAQRLPDKYWKSSVGGSSSSGDDYWHRNNYSGSDWTSITSGSYSPSASTGSYSARFHNAPATASTTGALDLHLNLSPAGTKTVSFDFIHAESSPSPFSFQVLLSTNGGSTFPTTLLTITTASFASWSAQTLTTSATSSTSVLRFIATDKGLEDVGIDNLQVTVSTSPLTSTGTQTNILCNGSLTGAAHVTPSGGVTPYTYNWAPSGGTSSTASGLAAGVYTCTITDASSLTATKVFTISQPAPISVNTVASPTAVCSGKSCTLTASATGGTGPYTYTWAAGPASNVYVIFPSLTATYTVNTKDANNCLKSHTLSVPVNTLPVVSANSGSVCAGHSFTIVPVGASTYTIQGGSAVVSPTANSTYTVKGTSAQGCVSTNAATSTITVNSLPALNVNSSSTLLCAGQQATLTATGASTYTWSGGSGGNNLIITPTVTSSYSVSGTAANSCTNSSVYTQSVSACTNLLAVSSDHSSLVIYPNPNNGNFVVKVNEHSLLSRIELYNQLGQLILRTNFDKGEQETIINNLAKGIYFVSLYAGDSKISTQKIVVTAE